MADQKKEPSIHGALLLGKSEDGKGQHVVFERDGKANFGVVTPLKEGSPIDPDAEVVEVHTSGDGPLAVLKSHGRLRATSQGPAMVNTSSYKTGWDHVFGKTKNSNKSLN